MVLALAVVFDLSFIELYRKLGSAAFDIEVENAYPEFYENLKEFFIAGMAIWLFIRKKEVLYGCWAGLLTYLFVDDTFQLHERIGAFLGSLIWFHPPFGLRTNDVGELIVSAVVGTCFLVALTLNFRQGTREAKGVSLGLLGLLISLAAFGVVVDMVHIVIQSEVWKYRLGLIEDGGEMLVVSSMLAFVLWRLLVSRRDLRKRSTGNDRKSQRLKKQPEVRANRSLAHVISPLP